MTEKWYQSKTVWAGVGQIIAGVSGYCTGQMDISGAGALVLSGLYQIIQRVMALKQANPSGGMPGATGS
jgi:hypothetical protein